MKTILRILAFIAGLAAGVFGIAGVSVSVDNPDGVSIAMAVFFLLLCAGLMYFALHRSPQEKAEKAARRKAEDQKIAAGRAGREAYAQEQAAKRRAEDAAWHAHVQQDIRRQAAAGGEEDPEDDDDFRDDEDDREEVREPAAAAAAAPVVPAASDAPVIPTVSAASDAAVRNARAQKQSSIWETKAMKEQRLVRERKEQAAAAGVACCPRCGSTSLALNKKGFGGGKATAGMFLTGGVGGAVAGTYGMNKMKITCLNCGYEYTPGKKTKI